MEEVEMSIDELIEYLDCEKFMGANNLTLDDAIMMIENAFAEKENEESQWED